MKTFEELVERHREKLHELQAPDTQASKEQADISAARNRWERAKNAEKAAVEKRQADKEQAARDRTRRSGEGDTLFFTAGKLNRHMSFFISKTFPLLQPSES